jgi:hypothetical protein
MKGFPTKRPLLAQDGYGTESVAAMQGNRVIKDVKDAHEIA